MAAPPSNKFQWDYDVPNDEFWNSLPFATGRNFLQCFEESEIRALSAQFDASQSVDDKHRLLLRLTLEKLSPAEAGAKAQAQGDASPNSTDTQLPLYQRDFDAWQKLMLALETMQHQLGLAAEEEQTLAEMLAHPRPGQDRNWSALHMMARLLERQGRFAEAERAAEEVRPWMEAHPQVGRGSPPAMGNMRMILTAVWRQGRFGDGRRLYEEMRAPVEGMGETKFAQYQEEEGHMLETLMAGLERWRDDVRKQ
ncbi:hypothetical protein LQW54_006699 [Pestalotiopsis sp. IQ-011]